MWPVCASGPGDSPTTLGSLSRDTPCHEQKENSMQIVLSDDEVRRYVRMGIYDELRKEAGDVVLHQSGAATVYVSDESGPDSDEEA